MNKKKFVKIVILAAAGLSLSAPMSWAASSKKYVKEGNQLYKKGQIEESVKKYEEALKKAPESPMINYNLGTAYYKKKDYEKAVEHLEKCLLTDDKDLKGKAYYNLGNAYYQMGMTLKNQNPDLAAVLLEKAKTSYEEAAKLNPDDKDTKNNLAQAQKQLEKLEKKRKAMAKHPGNGLAAEGEKKAENSKNFIEDDEAKKKILTESPQSQNQSLEKESRESNEGSNQPKQGQAVLKKEDQKGAPGSQAADKQSLTFQEADMLLQDYEAAEEPKGLLKTFHSRRNLKEVEKDW